MKPIHTEVCAILALRNGRPTIRVTGIYTRTLAATFFAGETIDRIVWMFNVTQIQVEHAIRFDYALRARHKWARDWMRAAKARKSA